MTDRRTGIVIGLVLGIAAVVLFVFVLSDDTVDAPAVDETTTAETTTAATTTDEKPGEKVPPPKPPPEPPLPTINVVGGQPQGGVQTFETENGQKIAFRVRADAPDHVHVHGYDLFEDVGPGTTATFSFVAEIDGVFEVELEDSAVLIAELRVNP